MGLIVRGKHLDCDFTSLTSSGYTNAQFDVLSLVQRALIMVWPLADDRDVAEIRLLDETIGALTRPPSLFDILDERSDGS